MITMLEEVCLSVCFVVIFSTSCSSKSLDLVNSGNSNSVNSGNASAVNSNRLKSEEKLYYLDLNNPSIAQPIDAETGRPEASKFVRVEVAEVINPKKHPLIFQVHYQTDNNEKVYLGSFSLYPPDNPGKFIVATQGKVKSQGAIVLSLVRPERVEPGDTVKVGVKKIRLTNG